MVEQHSTVLRYYEPDLSYKIVQLDVTLGNKKDRCSLAVEPVYARHPRDHSSV